VILIKEDDAANPAQGVERVRRLVEREQIHVLTGITSSAVAYAVRGYVDQRQVPLIIMGSAGANDLTDKQASPYIFRTSFSNRQLGGVFGAYACQKLGYKKIAVMASDSVTGHEQAGAFEAELKKAGCDVVKKIMVPLGTSDYAPFLSQLASTDATAVWAMFFSADAIAFVKQYEALGLKGKLPLIGPSGLIDPSTIQQMARSAVGISAPFNYLPSFDNPENKAFVDSFRAKYGRLPGATAASGYVGGMALAAALESIKGDVENKANLLGALKKVTFKSPSGTFRFDEKQNVIFDFYLGRVAEKNGDFAIDVVEPVMKNVNQFGVSN
jgi:branched-chain amino acid transport system substrate-binding protein